MVTSQHSNWTIYYARSRSRPNRFHEVVQYHRQHGDCWACQCEDNRINRNECDHIVDGKAGRLKPAELKAGRPQRPRRVVVSAEARDHIDMLDVG